MLKVANSVISASQIATPITFAGDVTLSTGNLVVANGKGIDFSATPGTGTSELLADYEEGTWTPAIIGTTSAGVGTYSTQNGTYTKVGRAVSFRLFLEWSAHTGTGNMNISGLPFATSSTTNTQTGLAVGFVNNITLTALNTLGSFVSLGSTTLLLRQSPAGGGINTAVALDTAVELMISGTYFV